MTAQPHETRPSPEQVRASIKNDRSPRALRAALPAEDHEVFNEEYRAAPDRAR